MGVSGRTYDEPGEPITIALSRSIVPEPTDDEAEAVAAVLAILRRVPAEAATPPKVRSRWAQAGRRAALRGLERDESGWGRREIARTASSDATKP
jgi:hypothetical protein